jgi:hypothetical protein
MSRKPPSSSSTVSEEPAVHMIRGGCGHRSPGLARFADKKGVGRRPDLPALPFAKMRGPAARLNTGMPSQTEGYLATALPDFRAETKEIPQLAAHACGSTSAPTAADRPAYRVAKLC